LRKFSNTMKILLDKWLAKQLPLPEYE